MALEWETVVVSGSVSAGVQQLRMFSFKINAAQENCAP